MRNPLVSIITPSYNRADFIVGVIDSVANQTYGNVEHIVIDGASTDGTLNILFDYACSGKLRYVSEPDHGMYDAINKGLALSRGDILAYINTDDRYLPWSIEVAVEFFVSHPEVDLIYGDTLVYDMSRGRKRLNILPSFSSSWLRSGGIIPQPTVFFRRRVYNKLGGYQRNVKYLADCEYWLRADQARMRFRKVHEVLAMEINHSGTIRQTLAQVLAAEKRLLLAVYCDRRFQHRRTKTLILRAKYLEKELLTLCIALNMPLIADSWRRFKITYDSRIALWQYLADKLLRTSSDIWRVEERLG